MPSRNATNALVSASVSAGIAAALIAAAYRWRAEATDLASRAGFAAGLAWSAILRFGAWLRDRFTGHDD